jgi:hypothetical protein
MASTINASTSPAAIVQTADGTANLSLQSNGTTIAALTSTGMAVTGTLSASGVTTFAAGTAALPAITTTGDTDTGIWFPAANTVAASTSGTEAMRIDSSGNLLLNLTSQQSSGKFCINFDGTVYNGQVLNETSGASGTIAYTYFLRSGTLKGSITYASGTNLVSYNTTSDYRLKENIVPLPNGLDTVMKLKPSQYSWKENGYTTTGFIAHELQEFVPDCVTGDKDAVDADGNIKPQGVDTSFLVATLTAAIQEQQALITSLTARITALEGA